MKRKAENSEQIKPDLKHDNMEWAASTDGDDAMDLDQPENLDEDEGISAEELNFLEAPDDEQAMALNSVETDRLADDDVIFDENDVDEEYDDES